MKTTFLVLAVLTGLATCILIFSAKPEKMWICTIEYSGEASTLTAEESRQIKTILETYAKDHPLGTTDEKETAHPPHSVFRFTADGAEPIRYLVYQDFDPFRIEVAVRESKNRRCIRGNEKLREQIKILLKNKIPEELLK